MLHHRLLILAILAFSAGAQAAFVYQPLNRDIVFKNGQASVYKDRDKYRIVKEKGVADFRIRRDEKFARYYQDKNQIFEAQKESSGLYSVRLLHGTTFLQSYTVCTAEAEAHSYNFSQLLNNGHWPFHHVDNDLRCSTVTPMICFEFKKAYGSMAGRGFAKLTQEFQSRIDVLAKVSAMKNHFTSSEYKAQARHAHKTIGEKFGAMVNDDIPINRWASNQTIETQSGEKGSSASEKLGNEIIYMASACADLENMGFQSGGRMPRAGKAIQVKPPAAGGR